MDWRERLRLAVKQDGRKQAAIAWQAGIAHETLNRVLNGAHERPQLETVVKIAHAVGVTVGWVLDERRAFTDDQQRKLRIAAAIIMETCR